jgi:putative hemolysin
MYKQSCPVNDKINLLSKYCMKDGIKRKITVESQGSSSGFTDGSSY